MLLFAQIIWWIYTIIFGIGLLIGAVIFAFAIKAAITERRPSYLLNLFLNTLGILVTLSLDIASYTFFTLYIYG